MLIGCTSGLNSKNHRITWCDKCAIRWSVLRVRCLIIIFIIASWLVCVAIYHCIASCLVTMKNVWATAIRFMNACDVQLWLPGVGNNRSQLHGIWETFNSYLHHYLLSRDAKNGCWCACARWYLSCVCLYQIAHFVILKLCLFIHCIYCKQLDTHFYLLGSEVPDTGRLAGISCAKRTMLLAWFRCSLK